MSDLLIEKLRQDMIAARKGSDTVTKSLMVTLYSEAAMVGKNKRNGDTTDDEAVAVIKKLLRPSTGRRVPASWPTRAPCHPSA